MLRRSAPVAGLVTLVVATLGTSPAVADEPTDVHRYAVTVEGEVESDAEAFETRVRDILDDPRGWSLDGKVRFDLVADDPQTTIVLASPDAVDDADEGCSAQFSCRVGDRVLVNERNWREMTPAWRAAGGDLSTYREYLINHEVGHVLGFGHHDCPGPGQPAPVMQQQSMGLDGCLPHGWPDRDERRAFAERAGLPLDAADVTTVQNDGVPRGDEARQLRDRLVAQQVLRVHVRRVAEPVAQWLEAGVGTLQPSADGAGPPPRD